MEDKQSSCKKTLMSIEEGKLSRQVACDYRAGDSPRFTRKALQLDLEINRKTRNCRSESKVSVIIKPRESPSASIHTIFVPKGNCLCTKNQRKVCSQEAIGDNAYNKTCYRVAVRSPRLQNKYKIEPNKYLRPTGKPIQSSGLKCIENTDLRNINNDIKKQKNKFDLDATPKSKFPLNFFSKAEKIVAAKQLTAKTANLHFHNPKNTAATNLETSNNGLSKRIDKYLQKKILQEMVLRSLDGNVSPPSSDEEPNGRPSKSAPGERAGCSYIEQYSHVPETSAFQRHALPPLPPLSPRGVSIEKEHNSEQYGRDFTTYDGITARSRRQSASVPCKRDDTPRQAAERVHKIRHKLNPVRDYRLMDTVHYLAQGEFAPRDDGIKLTPSREAVLSDIIWEDVCRTHWPNARLNRRIAQHPERSCSNRRGSGELQRLIDNLLRERVAHVERRRRRHYRIVKLNNRHENSKPVGKTGDIIVASHKKKDRDLASSDHRATTVISERKWAEQTSTRRGYKSHDRLMSDRHRHSIRLDESAPGPSYAVNRVAESREQKTIHKAERSNQGTCRLLKPNYCSSAREATSSSASNASNKISKPARLVIRKDVARRRHQREEPNLEHYILLPTLVVRTPSNMRRQKKFNELYHRILHLHFQNKCDGEGCAVGTEAVERRQVQNRDKKDIGFNINITLTDSEEHCKKS